MKKIFFTMGAIALLASCNNAPKDSFIIMGKTKGLEDGTKVYLEKQGDYNYIKIDSTEIKKGTFEIKGKADESEISYLFFDGNESAVPFVLENGKINVEFDSEKPKESKLSGTKNNTALYTFTTESGKIYNKMMEFQQNSGEIYNNARLNNDKKTMDSLMVLNEKFENDILKYNVSFIKENDSSFLSVIILNQLTQGGSIPIDEAKAIFENMNTELKEMKLGKELSEFFVKVEKINIGKIAPDFSAPSPEGKMISLKESLGKVTIIDFWASWCGPCREENPNVVKIYNKYHDKGLNIIGVSLDRDAANWKEAIDKDHLTWTHISNLKYWKDPIADDYSVRSIPATFILDENGTIVAKNLRGDELEQKISELLSK